MDKLDLVKDTALRMRALIADGGLPPFDRIRYNVEDDELLFLWEERQLGVVVALGEVAGSDAALTDALDRVSPDDLPDWAPGREAA